MTFNRFPEIAVALRRAGAKIVKKAAFDVQALAQARCVVQTGYLKSSIYTHTFDSSTYGQGVVGGGPGAYLLPDVGKPANDQTAFVGVGANYGVYVEFGTSKMAAQPYLTPAADEVAPSYQAAWQRLEEKLREEGIL
jgi:HK97 gp10 family phage protein